MLNSDIFLDGKAQIKNYNEIKQGVSPPTRSVNNNLSRVKFI